MTTMTSTMVVRLQDLASGPARHIGSAIARLRTEQKATAHQMRAVRGEMMGAVGAAYAMSRAISAPVKAAIEFESAMADVRKVVDFATPELFKELSRDVLGLSMRLPIAATGIAEIVAAAGQAGMKGDELLAFAEMAAKVGVAFDISADLAGTSLAKMKTALQLSVSETAALADSINHLTNNMASSAPDMIDFMSRVAAVGKTYGFAATEAAAIGSAMIASGSQANVAATSFRNVGRALTKGEAATKAQGKAFKKLGLDAKEVAVAMQRDASGTLEDVLVRIRALPREIQAATLSQLFGDEARALAPLVENLDLYREALASVADEQNYLGSAQKEYAQRAATSGNKLELFKNKITATGISLGNALIPAILALTDAVTPMIMAFGDFAAAHPNIVAAATGIAVGLVALKIAAIGTQFAFLFMKGGMLSGLLMMTRVAGAALGILNPFALVRNSAAILRTALLFSGVGLVVAGIAAAGLLIYNNWDGLVAFFEGFSSGLMAGLKPLMPVIQPIVDAGSAILGWVTGLLGPIGATNDEWQGWGETVGGVVAGAIAGVIGLFEKLVGWMGAAVDMAKSFGAAVGSILGNGSGSPLPPSRDATGTDWQAYMPGLGTRTTDWHAYMPKDGTRAAGGKVKRGSTYMINEEGTELFTAGEDGYVHNARDSKRMMEGPSGSSAPNVNVAVSFGNIIIQSAADVDAIAEQLGNRLRQKIEGVMSDVEWSAV